MHARTSGILGELARRTYCSHRIDSLPALTEYPIEFAKHPILRKYDSVGLAQRGGSKQTYLHGD